MADRRYPRHRGVKPLPRSAAAPKPRKIDHPLFGKIPLVWRTETSPSGQVRNYWIYDRDYQPSLPRGAVRGEPRRQSYCYDVPKYFYVDEGRVCVQCGASFVFRAAEQKYWYETRQFNFASVPIRCVDCRRQRRTEQALREQIEHARAAVRADGKNPAAHLALARAIVDHHERTEKGDLNDAIAAARKAAELWADSAEPHFWEGLAHARADRRAKARRCLEMFLAHPAAPSSLTGRARQCLERLDGR